MNSENGACQSCGSEFLIEPIDFAFYVKIGVPPPTFCPRCRLQRRITARNERTLYRDTCDLCKKQMVSMYSSEKPFTVYCRECWYSDRWDPIEYGRPYDFGKPFFSQWRELIEAVPRLNLVQIRGSVNSDYANFTVDVKDIYLSQSVLYSENVYYSRSVDYSKDCFDNFNINHSEVVYETMDSSRNARSSFLVRSRSCIDSMFLFDCVNCQECFMSANLRNGRYVFRNEQLSKEEYKKRLGATETGNYEVLEGLKREFSDIRLGALHKFANVTKSVDCIGDNIENSREAQHCFDIGECDRIKWVIRSFGSKEVYDVYGTKAELLYEGTASGLDSYNNRVLLFGDGVRDSSYVEWCKQSSHLLGCTGLKKKEYCILNKQYSKEEYGEVLKKIMAHIDAMPYVDAKGRTYRFGDASPIELGLFAYNETLAQEYFPLTKEEAGKQGYPWKEEELRSHAPTFESETLPANIKDAPDSIVDEIIGCASCGRAYRILKQELVFMRRINIALPRKCPECRHKDRFSLRNPLELWKRGCACPGGQIQNNESRAVRKNTAVHFHGEGPCQNEFQTSYAPERPEVVYCGECYEGEVL